MQRSKQRNMYGEQLANDKFACAEGAEAWYCSSGCDRQIYQICTPGEDGSRREATRIQQKK